MRTKDFSGIYAMDMLPLTTIHSEQTSSDVTSESQQTVISSHTSQLQSQLQEISQVIHSSTQNSQLQSSQGSNLQPTPILQPSPTQDEPLFVNARQYHRILKRREARQKYEQQQQEKKQFVHLSRHLHAKKRPRGPGGRFLSAQELEQLKHNNEAADDNAGEAAQ
jgi:LAS superfamily LD-carboxypeptidase LdcB